MISGETCPSGILTYKIKSKLCAFQIMYISDYVQTTFFYLGRFLKKISDDQCSILIKGGIYHIKHMSLQPLTMGVDRRELGCLMKYLLCLIFAPTASLLCCGSIPSIVEMINTINQHKIIPYR